MLQRLRQLRALRRDGLLTLQVLGQVRSILYAMVKRQEDILKIMALLPQREHTYTYSQVDAALLIASLSPETVYMSLSANERALALTRFLEALERPQIAANE
jgi:hypothetical protein